MIQIRFWVGTFQSPLSPRQRTPLFHLSALYTSFRRFSTPLTSFSSDGIMVPRQGSPFGLRGSKCFDPSPDVGHATVGSHAGRDQTGCPPGTPFFDPFRREREETHRRPGLAGSGQRGSALCPGRIQQRWEAVFRRERGPVSPDRTQGGPCLSFRAPICGPSGPEKGETLSAFVCFPIHFERSTFP